MGYILRLLYHITSITWRIDKRLLYLLGLTEHQAVNFDSHIIF